MPAAMCVCGHERTAHEHYRAGTDCSLCGAAACPRFRRAILRRTRPPASPGSGGGAEITADDVSTTARILSLSSLRSVFRPGRA